MGIGGIGMSGIAEILLTLGYPVSGSDIKSSEITQRLKKLGARISVGHKAKNVGDADVVVMSSAVTAINPEIVEAKQRKITVIQRAEMLAEIMRLAKYGIAVAGTHGKTTTTSLIASILQTANFDPTIIIGGKVLNIKTSARYGKGDFLVAEADESDGSFLKLMPTIAVVTNMDPEHLDHYGNFEAYRQAFEQFANQLPFYGLAVLCGEHPETVALSKKMRKRFVQYGFSSKHDYNAQNLALDGPHVSYDLYKKDGFVCRISLATAGKHNVLNSLAAIAVADEIGVTPAQCQRGLAEFAGVGRRMEILFRNSKITVIDDYGHHPSEILATLKTVKQAFAGRLVVLFQPHRFSRTRDLFDEFVTGFDQADELFVANIYPASESPIKGVNGRKLADALKKRRKGHTVFLPNAGKNLDQVANTIKPGDVFLSLGAGDVTKWGRQIARKLADRFL